MLGTNSRKIFEVYKHYIDKVQRINQLSFNYTINNHNLFIEFYKYLNNNFKIERHICEEDPLNIYICRSIPADNKFEVMKIQNAEPILNIKDNYNDLFWEIYDIFKNINTIRDVIDLNKLQKRKKLKEVYPIFLY